MTAWRHYWRPDSGTLVIEVAFAWAGLVPERVRVERSEQHEAEFLALNPAAQIPVVVMPDGTLLTETAAIVIAIDEAVPQAGLLPPIGTAARATSLRWLMLLVTSVYSAALRTYYSHRFTTDPSEAGLAGVREAAQADSRRLFDILAREIEGPFLLGRQMTIVDVYAAMLAGWCEPGARPPALQVLHRSVMAQPAIAQAWRRHEEGTE